MSRDSNRALRRLAALWGIQHSYAQVPTGRRREAAPGAVLAVLRALGAPVATFRDVPAALRERQQDLARRPIEPVVVAWDGIPPRLSLRLPRRPAARRVECVLDLEGGGRVRMARGLSPCGAKTEETGSETRFLDLPGPLPYGYHQLKVRAAGREMSTLLLSAPLRAWVPPGAAGFGHWGAFLPLYALRTRRSWAAGDLGDLEAMLRWIGSLGGSVVATLPLLPMFLDRPLQPWPYYPVSRLFWSEFYLDVEQLPELASCARARRFLDSPAARREIAALRRSPLVDYRRGMALKRKVLAELARSFFSHPPGPSRRGMGSWLSSNPRAEGYARFRAACERLGVPWQRWPVRARGGTLRSGDYEEEVRRYYLYVQWRMAGQVAGLASRAREKGLGLYLDFPLGTHPDGYDVWKERGAFALGTSTGAPPDSFFTKGQDWGFPPLHPEGIREQGYRYLIEALRHHFRHAGVLRIDHIMGLHRLFWVPAGFPAHEGVYVRYRPEEIYAILALESNRHRTLVVGEDLGTVPREVPLAEARHGILSTYVLQYELASHLPGRLRPVPAESLAAVNTHDMPTFASFFAGLDVRDRQGMGLLDAREAARERASRDRKVAGLASRLLGEGTPAPSRGRLLGAALRWLGASPARVVIANLEDLWSEKASQNTPGTTDERPNWRRKARHDLGTFSRMPAVRRALRGLARARRKENR